MPALFDRITAMATLLRAFDRVEENHGGPGVDGETVEDFATQLESRLLALRQSLRSGSYRPAPLLHMRMAKAEGGIRILRIPCVRDRVAQTAAALVLTPVLDPEFEDVSYGYREGRSVDQAVRRIMQLRDRGFRWVVDADIERYFDEIASDKLLERLARHVNEEAVLALVRRWLTAEVTGRDRRIPHDQGRSAGLPALAAAREPLPRPPRRGAPACRTQAGAFRR